MELRGSVVRVFLDIDIPVDHLHVVSEHELYAVSDPMDDAFELLEIGSPIPLVFIS